nr:hypothetical protein [Bacillus subtilis]MDH3147031.1 hypothetical protein [Bacillus subtilis]
MSVTNKTSAPSFNLAKDILFKVAVPPYQTLIFLEQSHIMMTAEQGVLMKTFPKL